MSTRLLIFAFFLLASPTAEFAKAEPPKPKDGPLGMKFVPLPKGTTYLGWNGTKGSAKQTEIEEAFEIAIHTVTQEQWQKVMGKNPSWYSRDNVYLKQLLLNKDNDSKEAAREFAELLKDIKNEDLKHFPVEHVSLEDCQAFLKKLNEAEKTKGWIYRLPTSDEWEYACRAGAKTEEECSYDFYFSKPTNDLSTKEANYLGLYQYGKGKEPWLKRTTKVGSYAPNKIGLYDMHGNVCQLTSSSEYFGARIARGGSCMSPGEACRAGSYSGMTDELRSTFDGPVGLRLVRVPEAPAGK